MTKEESRQFCKTVWEKQHGFVIIDLSNENTMVGIEVGLTSFTYQIEIKTIIIIFSFKNEEFRTS